MKITKFVHSCLLVETPDRVVLFDPGTMSGKALDVGSLDRLDDIFITHIHPDHCSVELIAELVDKFPQVRITGPQQVVDALMEEGIMAQATPPEGVVFFNAPHENVKPVYPQPEEIGIHYLDVLTDPGDSHSFNETREILALPVTAPWGANITAVNLALKLKPTHILPIHDWHWNDDARQQTYDEHEKLFAEHGITFHKLETGKPVDIDVAAKVAA